MLLVARTLDKSFLLLDPLHKSGSCADIYKAVICFFKSQYRRNSLNSDLECSWSDAFIHSNTETAHFGAMESGLYIMKKAEGFARCCNCDLEQDSLQGYGAYILEKLVRTSLRNVN